MKTSALVKIAARSAAVAILYAGCKGSETDTTPEPASSDETLAETASALAIIALAGTVELQHETGRESISQVASQAVSAGDTIVTGDNGQLALRIEGGKTVVLKPNSSVTVAHFETTVEGPLTRLVLNRGEVYAFGDDRSDGDELRTLEIVTPSGMAVTPDNQLIMTFTESHEYALISCLKGNCAVRGGDWTGILRAYEAVELTGVGARFEGVFYIDDAVHQMLTGEAEAYQTLFSATRNGTDFEPDSGFDSETEVVEFQDGEDVIVRKRPGTASFPASDGQMLTTGDQIIVGPGGFALLELGDGTAITITEHAELTLTSQAGLANSEFTAFRLDAGEVFLVPSAGQSENMTYEITTPNAVAVSNSSSLSVFYYPTAGMTAATCPSGESLLTFGGETSTCADGQTSSYADINSLVQAVLRDSYQDATDDLA